MTKRTADMAKKAKPWMTKRRAEIAKDIVQSVPMERIIAAALLVMNHQRVRRGFPEDEVFSPTTDEIANWLEQLDADRLLILRDLAESLEGGVEQ
jgi:hypothetical protein